MNTARCDKWIWGAHAPRVLVSAPYLFGVASPDNSPAFQRWVSIERESEVPLGTAEPCLFDGVPVVREGTGMFLATDFPSVETLGYFQETQALNRYSAARRNELYARRLSLQPGRRKVRDDDGIIASTRGACATQHPGPALPCA